MSTTTTLDQDKVILYDLPTKKPQYGCWSPNVWKSRLILNYKKIPYTTVWLKHPSIEPTLRALGLAPNQPSPGVPVKPSPYTVPAIRFPDGSAAMDSAVIASRLEERYPEPSLRLENGLHEKVGPVMGKVAFPLLGILYPRIGRDILLEEVYPGWKAKREAQLGMSLEEFEASRGGETAWNGAEDGFKALSEFLREYKVDQGPFLLGSRVCYGDFMIASLLESCKRIGDDVYERVIGYDEALKELHTACGEWLKEDR